MKKRPFGKKRIVSLIGHIALLAHNDALKETLSKDQVDKAFDHLKQSFNEDEEKVLKYIKNEAKRMMRDLEESKNENN